MISLTDMFNSYKEDAFRKEKVQSAQKKVSAPIKENVTPKKKGGLKIIRETRKEEDFTSQMEYLEYLENKNRREKETPKSEKVESPTRQKESKKTFSFSDLARQVTPEVGSSDFPSNAFGGIFDEIPVNPLEENLSNQQSNPYELNDEDILGIFY